MYTSRVMIQTGAVGHMGRRGGMHTGLECEILTDRDNWEYIDIDGNTILKWIFKIWLGIWTGLIWLRIWTGDGFL